MSFKREGNDSCLLNTLRKRRIKELFSEDIPEDEAKLLSNGRFACLVCHHKPIFDTVSMLSIHRKGKKHLFDNEIYLNKKRELMHLINARKHEQYLKDGTTLIKMSEPKHTSILSSQPYDPRVKKLKLKNDHEVSTSLTNTGFKKSMSPADNSTHLPGHSHWSDMCQQQMSVPVTHDHRLKNIFSERDRSQEYVRCEPYKSKYRPTITTLTVPISCDTVKNTDSKVLIDERKIANSSTSNQAMQVYGNTSNTKLLPQTKITKSKQSQTQVKKTNLATAQGQNSTNKLKQLSGSGWKRDWDGSWIKDATAEFDSDEEPPDIPLQL
ncbi:sodium channel modifier 1-like isoform X1 [Biomphalaria glabrata]|nr:sodium channel modifier 1-like isoform X1 [Biomphalaria glabrata]